MENYDGWTIRGMLSKCRDYHLTDLESEIYNVLDGAIYFGANSHYAIEALDDIFVEIDHEIHLLLLPPTEADILLRHPYLNGIIDDE